LGEDGTPLVVHLSQQLPGITVVSSCAARTVVQRNRGSTNRRAVPFGSSVVA
jgi:hypothetical protein